MEDTKYKTFEAHKPHFDALARVGYFRLLSTSSPIKQALHVVYRYLVWVLVLAYNLQHVIRAVQVRHSVSKIVDILFILLTTLCTLSKHITFNVKTRQLDGLLNVINGPIFESRNSYHVKVMKENALMMRKLLRFYIGSIFTCGFLWTVFPLVNRALGLTIEFTGYIPFDTNSSPGFEIALAYMSFLITFQAYGNVTMDCTIVAFYAQAKVQLQMLRYNLEHLADCEGDLLKKKSYLYRDVEDMGFKQRVQTRLVRCVRHHQQIIWFIKEIEAIFAEGMIFQFFVTAWVICMTVYKLVGLSLFSAEFFSMVMYLCCILGQLFIYSFYGTQVKYESEFVNQSAYCGAWLSLSPSFRRQMLVMMVNCTEPITPRLAYIVPISLETYISVLRASYTLFTFLDRK